MFNLKGPQGQNPRTTCGPRTTVWETLIYNNAEWVIDFWHFKYAVVMNREIRYEDSCHEIHEMNCGSWRRENCYIGTDISEEPAVGATVMLESRTDLPALRYKRRYSPENWKLRQNLQEGLTFLKFLFVNKQFTLSESVNLEDLKVLAAVLMKSQVFRVLLGLLDSKCRGTTLLRNVCSRIPVNSRLRSRNCVSF